jgi:hypothetical protein
MGPGVYKTQSKHTTNKQVTPDLHSMRKERREHKSSKGKERRKNQ